MAQLTDDQVVKLWANGDCEKFALFAVKNVDTGDTHDFTADFRVVMQAAWLGATVSGVAQGAVSADTVVAAPAGLTNAGAYLLVQGVAR